MTLSTRTLMQALAALAIAASVSGVLSGATDAAYAAQVDRGHTLLHGHQMVAPTARSRMKARRQDTTAVEAAVLAQKVSAILAAYRLGHIHIVHCDIVCLRF